MKNVIFTVCFILVVSPLFAKDLTFIWIANPAEEQITGYRLYQDCGSEACIIADIVNPSTTTITIPSPADNHNHAFSLTAYRVDNDEINESLQSDYAVYSVSKTRPSRRNLTMIIER